MATFKDEESAKAAQAQPGGELFTSEQIQQETWDQPPGPHDH